MFKEVKNLLLKSAKNLIIFEIIFKLLTLLIATPLFTAIFRLIMKVTGYDYLTLENIFKFILNPITLILGLLLLIVITFYSIFDIGVIVTTLDAAKQGKSILIKDAVAHSFKRALRVFRPRNFGLIIYILFLIPFLGLGTGSSVIASINLPEFITDYISANTLLSVIVLIAFIALLALAIKWTFSMHYYFLEDKSFPEAIGSSSKLIKHHTLKDFLKIFGIQLLIAIAYSLILIAGLLLIALFTNVLQWSSIIESIFISIIAIILVAITIIIFALNSTLIYACISALFYHHKNEQKEKITHINIKKEAKSFSESKWRFVVIGIAAVALLGMTSFVNGIINHEYNFNIIFDRNMDITAHRGASVKYPENTMAAFIGAKELGADWAELDVQQTKDLQLIVSHDENFQRLTGVNLNVWDATYDEISQLDAGSFKGEQFKGEKIPLLEDVIKWAKENDLRLNIELKPTGHETNFEQQVIDLINKYDYKDRCVVTSQVYEVLENIKQIDNDIHTVYVMSLAIGDLSPLDKADSFSIEAANIDENMVSSLHNQGKRIYAWTINTEDSINSMIDLNVDNIVTDNITLARELVNNSKSSNLILEILKLIYK